MLPKVCLISDLLQKMSKPTNTPQLALDHSTTLYQLLGNSLSRTGGTNLCCKRDYFLLCPLNCLNIMPKKKSLFEESYQRPRYAYTEKEENCSK